MLKRVMQMGALGSKGLTNYITVFSKIKLSQLLGFIEMEFLNAPIAVRQ
jgi:hypothetical protein